MSDYPECEKMTNVRPQSDIVGEFLDWMSNKKEYNICEYHEDGPGEAGGYYPINSNIEELLADFFEIDLKKIEEERRQMLDDIRRKNDPSRI